MSIFAQNLRRLRQEKGLTQKQLAKLANISHQSISYYENGERPVNSDSLIAIAKCLGVSTDYLLGISKVSSLDTDMQAVCDYIGLDDVGVGIIENAATKGKNVLLMIENGKVKKIMETEGVIEWQV